MTALDLQRESAGCYLRRIVRLIVCMPGLSSALADLLGDEHEIVDVASTEELLHAQRESPTISFVDGSLLGVLDAALQTSPPPRLGPVIAICEGVLQSAVRWLPEYSWLSHAMSFSSVTAPGARLHLHNVMRSMGDRAPRLLEWLGEHTIGRHVRLAHASRRSERLERMSAFFEEQGVQSRTRALLRDVGEELLTNAFYDAPVAAGMVPGPISRTQDVCLPEDGACNMVYACTADFVAVHVRDPFGALVRDRLIQVLARCAQQNMQVAVDETMGGAGLGLWRVFSVAAFVAVSVISNHRTEFLVGLRRRNTTPRPFAFHLFFQDRGQPARQWQLVDSENTVRTSVD